MLKRYLPQFHCRLHRFTPYSTSSVASSSKNGITNPLMVEFLINSVGFSEDEAVSIVTNRKVSHRFKTTTKPGLVVDFLKNSGFHEIHIRNLVAKNPMVLRCKVEKTLKPKLRVFQELGFSGSDIGAIISHHPSVLKRSLKAHIVPALEMLKSLTDSNDQFVSLIKKARSQKLLSTSVLKYLPSNLPLLQSYGVPREKLKSFMLRHPFFLSLRTQWVQNLVKGAEEKLGIPRTSAMFLYGVIALSSRSDASFEQMRQLFRSYGWSETQISKLLRSYPLCLSLSEKGLRAKLKYFMEDLGYGCDYLVTHPALLSYSLERRIVPRTDVMKALKEKGLLKRDVSLCTFLQMAESKFMEKYMLPVRDELPQLYDYYTQKTAVSLAKT